MEYEVVQSPPTAMRNSHYLSNRAPLCANPLVKLPLGSVHAHGWLGHQIDLMVDGMSGRLEELSSFLHDENGWFGTDNEGWEEQPYWLRGFYPLAVMSGNSRCLSSAKIWIDAVIGSQDEDGYFGAPFHKSITGRHGRSMPDLWPHMVMLDAVIQHHEWTGDARVIPFMERFFSYCLRIPDKEFIPEYVWREPEGFQEEFRNWKLAIQHKRAGDMIPHIYWLYNHTGESWLLPLAQRFFHRIQPPEDEWLDHHVVHFTQRFQYPGIYSAYSHNPRHLAMTEYWYAQHLATWGQQPRGIFAADERIRPGKVDPRQGFETCGMVEFAKSFYLLSRVTGASLYADRVEDIMLNHFPVSQTPDLKALHYLSASNQPQLDCSELHDYCNKGRQIDYSPHLYRCCQHNVAMGWPWYAQNLWMASSDNGLVAWIYAASSVTAIVGEGTRVTLTEETDYPFQTSVRIVMNMQESCVFPLYLRVPRWCSDFGVRLRDTPIDVRGEPNTYVCLRREWSDGDTVSIEMPVSETITTWPRNGSVTVDRGPLSYSLKIDEEWRRCGGSDEWPEWEVLPKSSWNYALVTREDGLKTCNVDVRAVPAQPWTSSDAPLQVEVAAKRIPEWRLGSDKTIEDVPQGSIDSDQPEELLTLIPMGCARLRVSCFPTVTEKPGSDENPD